MPVGAILVNVMNGFAEPVAPTFWVRDPVAFTPNPVAYDPIEGGDEPPWN